MIDKSKPGAPVPPSPVVVKASRWPAVLALLALLIVLALVGVGHLYWQQMQLRFGHLRQVMEQSQVQQQSLIKQVEETSRAFNEQREQLIAQQAQIHEQIKTIEAQAAKLNQQRAQLSDQGEAVRRSLRNLHQQGAATGQQWRAAEAAYLIELGQTRLRLEHDPATAIEALKGAAQRLAQTGDPYWDPVRQALRQDLQELQNLPAVDRQALAKDLLRLAIGVNDLPLRPLRYQGQTRLAHNSDSEDADKDLDSLLQDGWKAIKSLVRIHKDDWTDSAPPGPAQGNSLRNSLRLQLDAARFGLLSKDQRLYQGSLETAETWLDSFFKPDATETDYYRQEILRLRGIDILPPLPDLQPTLETLRGLLDSRVPAEGPA